MSGFDNWKVDEAFLAGTNWQSNFLVNLGHADPAGGSPGQPAAGFRRGLPAGIAPAGGGRARYAATCPAIASSR